MDRLRVLIVEDDPHSRKALATLFRRSGWRPIQAATVAEGVAGLDPAPDCAVLDLRLPDGDGEAILRKIRRESIPVRVVAVVSGESDPSRLGEVAELKPDLMVRKPIDWEVIWRY